MEVIVKLNTTTCCRCGTVIACEAGLMDSLRRNGRTLYCIIGHGQSFSTDAQNRADAERDRKAAGYDSLLQRAQRAEGEVARISRGQKRERVVKVKVKCQDCGLSFKSLKMHRTVVHRGAA